MKYNLLAALILLLLLSNDYLIVAARDNDDLSIVGSYNVSFKDLHAKYPQIKVEEKLPESCVYIDGNFLESNTLEFLLNGVKWGCLEIQEFSNPDMSDLNNYNSLRTFLSGQGANVSDKSYKENKSIDDKNRERWMAITKKTDRKVTAALFWLDVTNEIKTRYIIYSEFNSSITDYLANYHYIMHK